MSDNDPQNPFDDFINDDDFNMDGVGDEPDRVPFDDPFDYRSEAEYERDQENPIQRERRFYDNILREAWRLLMALDEMPKGAKMRGKMHDTEANMEIFDRCLTFAVAVYLTQTSPNNAVSDLAKAEDYNRTITLTLEEIVDMQRATLIFGWLVYAGIRKITIENLKEDGTLGDF